MAPTLAIPFRLAHHRRGEGWQEQRARCAAKHARSPAHRRKATLRSPSQSTTTASMSRMPVRTRCRPRSGAEHAQPYPAHSPSHNECGTVESVPRSATRTHRHRRRRRRRSSATSWAARSAAATASNPMAVVGAAGGAFMVTVEKRMRGRRNTGGHCPLRRRPHAHPYTGSAGHPTAENGDRVASPTAT